jgi:pilus assembly protein CpaE
MSAGDRLGLDAAFGDLQSSARQAQIVVVLRDADLMSTRRLIRMGAADVLPAPASELALSLSLERLFETRSLGAEPSGPGNEVVSFLKAGGGVGVTALIAQLAAILAGRGGKVGAVDLDVQFGNLGLYLDMADTTSIDDLLVSGIPLDETPFDTALAKHRSGAQVLAAPKELRPLESMSALQADALMHGLKRAFAVTLVDLPSVWTAWTDRVLHLSDRIVMVTSLSVPHINLVKRQLQVLAAQGLGGHPLTLVCNALSGEQQDTLSLKVAERALGRPFDVVLPEDRRAMNAAINQGVELSTIRRGTKLEKALIQMAGAIHAPAAAEAHARR